jgi:hypothetical protein
MTYLITDIETGDVYTGQVLEYDVLPDGTGVVLLDGAVVLNVPGIESFDELQAVFLQEFEVSQM